MKITKKTVSAILAMILAVACFTTDVFAAAGNTSRLDFSSPEIITLPNGFVFALPEGWKLEQSSYIDAIWILMTGFGSDNLFNVMMVDNTGDVYDSIVDFEAEYGAGEGAVLYRYVLEDGVFTSSIYSQDMMEIVYNIDDEWKNPYVIHNDSIIRISRIAGSVSYGDIFEMIYAGFFSVNGNFHTEDKNQEARLGVWGKIDGKEVYYTEAAAGRKDKDYYQFYSENMENNINDTFWLAIRNDMMKTGTVLDTDKDPGLLSSFFSDRKATFDTTETSGGFNLNCSFQDNSDWVLTVDEYDGHYLKGTITGKYGSHGVGTIDVKFCLTVDIDDIADTDAYEYFCNHYSTDIVYTSSSSSSSQKKSKEPAVCRMCNGSGRCHVCGGVGTKTFNNFNGKKNIKTCSACNGDGLCNGCGGTGHH